MNATRVVRGRAPHDGTDRTHRTDETDRTEGTRAHEAAGAGWAQREPNVFRIHWVPGTDRLLAVCFCAAERIFEDPVELWDWLLAHPDHPAEPAEPAAPSEPAEPLGPADLTEPADTTRGCPT